MPSLSANGITPNKVFATRTMGGTVQVSGDSGIQASPEFHIMEEQVHVSGASGIQTSTDSHSQTSTESLGLQTIEGVIAEGKRITTTIAAGAMGNQRPITTVTEEWFSQDLQMIVSSTTNDPRMGETAYRLTNIQRAEPPATLFTLPADYTVKDFGTPVTGSRPLQSNE